MQPSYEKIFVVALNTHEQIALKIAIQNFFLTQIKNVLVSNPPKPLSFFKKVKVFFVKLLGRTQAKDLEKIIDLYNIFLLCNKMLSYSENLSAMTALLQKKTSSSLLTMNTETIDVFVKAVNFSLIALDSLLLGVINNSYGSNLGVKILLCFEKNIHSLQKKLKESQKFSYTINEIKNALNPRNHD